AHSLPTSSSSVCFITRMHSTREEVFAGLRKGFAGCPCLPYSRILASLALLPPSLRGSEKPILMLWFPSRSAFTGERPKDASNSPVERESYLVPLPMTADRFAFTLESTT